MKKIAIVGFGCAGFHCMKALREEDATAEIHVFGDSAPANPMLTTYYVSGKLDYDGLFPFGTWEDAVEKYGIISHPNTVVAKVMGKERKVVLADGKTERFDKILLATGALPFALPVEKEISEQVYYMRTPKDALQLKTDMESGRIKTATVIGASMVGIKVAELLAKADIQTTMVDGAAQMFPLSAFPEVAEALQNHVLKNKVYLKLSTKIKNMKPSKGKINCEWEDGSTTKTDAVVLCIGVKANLAVIDQEEIKVGRGIVVDEHMETSCAGVYAAGDCCEAKNLLGGTAVLGLLANAAWQGKIAGAHMGGKSSGYTGNIPHNITHFMDMDFIGIGDNRVPGECCTWGSLEEGRYIKAVKSQGTIKCINILGSYAISGILKAHFMKSLECIGEEMSSREKGLLKQAGLSEEIIHFLNCIEGGNYHG